VLVNNAGVGSDFGVAGVAPDFDKIATALETNCYGAYRLTISLLGLLRARASIHGCGPRGRTRVPDRMEGAIFART
jgi:NAD(P)-dependent dehydrogenase (short-subunit alcohol dehydrogenase family)